MSYQQGEIKQSHELESQTLMKSAESRKTLARELLAEFLGTCVFLSLGLGTIAQTVLSRSLSNGGYDSGNWLTISLGFGISLCFGVLATGGSSRAHLNPAISLAMAIHGRFEWAKVPMYWSVQLLGAFLASVLNFTVYYAAIERVGYGKDTAGIFATYPASHMTTGAAFVNELLATALFVGAICSILDENGFGVEKSKVPFAVGLSITGVALSFGWETGFALNPARDFAPRLFTAMAGWGADVFEYDDSYFWVPVVAPCLGAVAGSSVYRLVAGFNRSSSNGDATVEQ